MRNGVSHLLRQTRRSTFRSKVKLASLTDLNLSWKVLNGRPLHYTRRASKEYLKSHARALFKYEYMYLLRY